jgi:uncharacterized membrane protein YphA (DoxX/SURF4 family)
VQLIGWLAQAALAIVFFVSAVAKVAALTTFADTVRRLGVPGRWANGAATIVVSLEFLAAVALAVVPASFWPRLLVVVLAVLFAGAGVKALREKEKIACSCLGGLSNGVLGWQQLQLLPVWLVLAGLAQFGPPSWDAFVGLMGLTAVSFIAVAGHFRRHLPAWWKLRAERLAVGELRDEAMINRTETA